MTPLVDSVFSTIAEKVGEIDGERDAKADKARGIRFNVVGSNPYCAGYRRAYRATWQEASWT